MAQPALSGVYRQNFNSIPTSVSNANGTLPDNMIIRLFADFQDYLDPHDTPLTASTKSGKAINQKKVEWLNRFLSPNSTTAAEALDDSETGVDVATGTGTYFQQYDVIKIDSEYLWVRSISGDTLTVTRGVGGSSAAAHDNGATIQIIAPALNENVQSPSSPVAKGSLEYNVPQLFDYSIQVSNRDDNTPDYEFQSGSKYDGYLKQVMKNAAVDFERALLLGKRAVEVVSGGDLIPSMMGGLDFFTDYTTNLSSAPLTETVIGDRIQALYNRVTEDKLPGEFLVGPFMRRVLSSLWNGNRYATITDTKSNLVWDMVKTDFGDIKFTLNRYIPDGVIYFLDTDDITRHPYKGGEWSEVLLPSNGPFKVGRFTGDYTAVFLNNAARHKIYGISTTAADYPNL